MMRVFSTKIAANFEMHLVRSGFPINSILHEQAIHGPGGQTFQLDFLIIDPINFERLAVFELKESGDIRTDEIADRLMSYRNALGDSTLPAFLAIAENPQEMEPSFSFFSLNSQTRLEKIDAKLLPTFQALVANKVASTKKQIQDEKILVTASFETISQISAGILVVLVIADFICDLYGIEVLTAERLSLIGGAVALLVIPHANRIKGLGLEWERAVSKRNDKD